jgi:hypothetical protein
VTEAILPVSKEKYPQTPLMKLFQAESLRKITYSSEIS